MMNNMYGGNILRVNLSEGKVSKEPTSSYSGDFLGGRGINVRILYDGSPPEVTPLDPASPLIFGVGPLCGTPVPSSRVEVTAKSPETGFLGTSNFGGFFGPELKYAGYDNIVFTGKADKPVYLSIYNDEVEIRDASHLWGQDTYKTQEIIRSQIDSDVKVACIGPAGENLVHFATVQNELGHGAGRTGTGAVMGSKNLKAIAVRGTKGINLANPEKYLSIVEELQRELKSDPCIQLIQKYGWTRLVAAMEPTLQDPKNRKLPIYPHDLVLKYQPGRTGCFGCPAQCMDLYPAGNKGGGVISCELYEEPTSMVRNTDLDLGLGGGFLAQRYGVDVVSAFMIIGWLMELYEKGIITAKDTDGIPMEWGSKEAILGMLKKMVYREGFGDVLADGILPAAERIGRGARDYANQVKGLPTEYLFTAYRKSSALSMAVGTRGDLMKSSTFGYDKTYQILPFIYDEKTAVEYKRELRQKARKITGTERAILSKEYEGKPELVLHSEDAITICDSLGICKFIGTGFFGIQPFTEKYQAALFSTGTGIETSVVTLFDFAKKVRNLERAYNVRLGITRETDSLPKRYMDRLIGEGEYSSGVLESGKFEEMKDKYYALRDWDIATGIPTREALEKIGLSDVARDLEKRGKLPEKLAEEKTK
jgi:aldehyde:ferredoxin oxidoreductase